LYSIVCCIVGAVIILLIVFVFSAQKPATVWHSPIPFLSPNSQTILRDNIAQLQSEKMAENDAHDNTLNTLNRMDQLAHSEKQNFIREQAPTTVYRTPSTPFAETSVQAQRLAHPDDTLVAGDFIPAVLETAINSNLPGMVRAIVSRPVFAYTGKRLLIPEGSRLIGQYTAALWQGQQRVLIGWERLILPNGVSVTISSPSSDNLGRSGQGADHINTHAAQRFAQAVLLSVLGAGTALIDVESSDFYNSSSQYRTMIADSLQVSAQQSLQQQEIIQPTLIVNQGALINVMVTEDISFYGVSGEDDDLLPT